MNAWGTVYCIQKERSLFVCWVICFQSQNETSKLSPEVASILDAFCAILRHPSPRVFKE